LKFSIELAFRVSDKLRFAQRREARQVKINYKFEARNPKFGKNPKFEYRNTKQFQNLNSKNPKPSNENFSRVFKCFEISILSFPCLFRVSDFVLRILLSI